MVEPAEPMVAGIVLDSESGSMHLQVAVAEFAVEPEIPRVVVAVTVPGVGPKGAGLVVEGLPKVELVGIPVVVASRGAELGSDLNLETKHQQVAVLALGIEPMEAEVETELELQPKNSFEIEVGLEVEVEAGLEDELEVELEDGPEDGPEDGLEVEVGVDSVLPKEVGVVTDYEWVMTVALLKELVVVLPKVATACAAEPVQ